MAGCAVSAAFSGAKAGMRCTMCEHSFQPAERGLGRRSAPSLPPDLPLLLSRIFSFFSYG